ncbi:VOC family protein [uncultured Rubinisphaera sp.]|uniref:VOC family protein n=1 Tax=uncultured Rubinisphaera sp. TaxID=1678686 RepID=UPI0030DC68CB|tara:strand:- start:1252 stop:1701 length:450 start_codon:yes stop_codon:yes gene_type:complete
MKQSLAETTSALMPFHLAVQVHDIAEVRKFYGSLLGCPEGRSAETWVDFDFFGHQFVCHLNPDLKAAALHHNPVDGHAVPVPHYGVVLTLDRWSELADKLQTAGVQFVIEPYIRFEGQPGEQGTMFFYDPSGNALEFKGFRDMNSLFAT